MPQYFEYSSNPENGKYMEVSREQFMEDVQEQKGRFYIPFGYVYLECSEAEFRAYRRKRNHQHDVKRDVQKKKVTLIPLEAAECQKLTYNFTEDDIIDKVDRAMMKKRLIKALDQLTPQEHFLIHAHYYQELTLEQIGQLVGTTRQNVHTRIRRCLVKLHKLIKK